MLKVWFGHDYPNEYVKGATALANRIITDSDLQDPFIKDMIYAVDNVTISSNGKMVHPVFGTINTSLLSNGVSGLIVAYKTDFTTDITRMGDNCLPWLLKIAEMKDITCVCCRIPLFDKDFTFQDLESGDILHTKERFAAYAYYKLMQEIDDPRFIPKSVT